MVRGLRIMVLGLCITSAMAFRAAAQQPPPNTNPNQARIQQLRQEMRGLRQQLEPLRSQQEQLMSQARTIRGQMHTIMQKLKMDRDQMDALLGTSGR